MRVIKFKSCKILVWRVPEYDTPVYLGVQPPPDPLKTIYTIYTIYTIQFLQFIPKEGLQKFKKNERIFWHLHLPQYRHMQ